MPLPPLPGGYSRDLRLPLLHQGEAHSTHPPAGGALRHCATLEERHAVHITAYGEGNERRLTGKRETSSMHNQLHAHVLGSWPTAAACVHLHQPQCACRVWLL